MSTGRAGSVGHAPAVQVGMSERGKYEEMWRHSDYREVSPGELHANTFIQQAKPPRGETVIDFGCGTGRGGLMLKALGGLKPIFVDFASNALDPDIRQACEDFPDKWKFVQHDLTKYPIPVRAKYGYCCDVMEHIPTENVHQVLANIMRSARNVFFAISTADDVCGKAHGLQLHMTVKPYSWWLEQFQAFHCNVFWSHEAGNYALFYVSGLATGKDLQEVMKVNVEDDTIYEHVMQNLRQGYQEACPHPSQDIEVMVLGGGPSLAQFEDDIRAKREAGMPLITTNGTYKWCLERGLKPSAQIMVDGREFNKRFVEPPIENCKYLLGSQCHPSAASSLPKEQVWLWHSGSCAAVRRALTDYATESGANRDWYPVYGGSSVMLRAFPLLRMLGFSKFHVYGLDSCLMGKQHHAYDQPENNGGSVIEVEVGGRKFDVEPWMWCQAEEFIAMTSMLKDVCDLEVYGDGLIAHIIKTGADMAERDKPNGQAALQPNLN